MRRIFTNWSGATSTFATRDALLSVGASLLVPVFVALALELPASAINRIAAPLLGQLSTAVRLPAPPADAQGSQSLRGRSPVSGSAGPDAAADGYSPPETPIGGQRAEEGGVQGSGPLVAGSLPEPAVLETLADEPVVSDPSSGDAGVHDSAPATDPPSATDGQSDGGGTDGTSSQGVTFGEDADAPAGKGVDEPAPTGGDSGASGEGAGAGDGGGSESGNPPGQSGDAPGNSGNAPGQSGDAPGNSGNAPGQSGDAPGNSGNAPGQS
ncbi:MAG: hypothetical protein WD380_10920, partial [Gaiellaceae bacterium]